jgi:hypothetical protein
MPLLDLKTDLKSLKFGNDRQGGGSSGLPYIQTSLPEQASQLELISQQSAKFSNDFPIRGGGKSAASIATDLIRITKFLADPGRGPFFVAKQVGLQLSNPRTEVGTVLGNTPYTQVYVPTNTLAQIGVQGTGIHWDRPGISPDTPDQLKYAYVVGQQVVTNNPKTNRLLALYGTKVNPGAVVIDPALNKKLGIDEQSQLNLFNYSNGPESFYGLGKTIIPRFETTTPSSASILQNPFLYGTRPNPTLDYRRYITASDAYMTQSGDVFGLGYVQAQGSFYLNNIGQQSDIVVNNFSTNRYPTNFRLITGSKPVFNYSKYTAAQEIFTSESRIQVVSGIEAGGQTFTAVLQQAFVSRSNFETTPFPVTFSGSYVRAQPTLRTNINGQTAFKLYNNYQSTSPLLESNSKAILEQGNDPNFSSPAGYTFTYSLIKQRANEGRNNRGQIPQDFRKILIDNRIGDKSLYSYDYKSPSINMQGRIGLADSGLTTFDRSFITSTNSATQDKVTMTPLDTQLIPGQGTARDLVKFTVEGVSNENPVNTTKIHLRAYVKGFSDNHTANWQGFQYTGRGDTFYTYQGFNREVGLSFSLPALSRPEMKLIYQKANYLASLCYPDYNSSGLMRGNIVLLTFGDYLYRVPGLLKSVNITIPDEASWEIAMSEPERGADTDMYELPQLLEINLAFTPIMSILPRRGAGVPLITRASKNNKFLAPVANIK